MNSKIKNISVSVVCLAFALAANASETLSFQDVPSFSHREMKLESKFKSVRAIKFVLEESHKQYAADTVRLIEEAEDKKFAEVQSVFIHTVDFFAQTQQEGSYTYMRCDILMTKDAAKVSAKETSVIGSEAQFIGQFESLNETPSSYYQNKSRVYIQAFSVQRANQEVTRAYLRCSDNISFSVLKNLFKEEKTTSSHIGFEGELNIESAKTVPLPVKPEPVVNYY